MKRRLLLALAAGWLATTADTAQATRLLPVTQADDPSRVDVAVRVLPKLADLGRRLDFFIFARLGDQLWAKEGAHWRSVEKVESLPAARSVVLSADQTLPVVTGLDVTSLDGVALLTGFGTSAQDMLTQGNYNLIYTASSRGADDPLYGQQWHLQNTGQSAYSRASGVVGEDLRVASVHAQGVRGQGVVVAIPDDGLDLGHIDLAANIVPGGSKNFITGHNDPTPSAAGDGHGTAVAGLIAAVGWNNVGGRGVAPEARLKGFNYLLSQSETNFMQSLGGDELAADVAVFNQSFGTPGLALGYPDAASQRLYRHGVERLREGKGAVFVKSAGNEFETVRASSAPSWACAAASQAGISCGSAQIDPANTLIENLVIGAFNAKGKRSSYSSSGANLLISAPAGEYGNAEPAMITTDLSGCTLGYALRDLPKTATAFSRGEDMLNNPLCDYTHRMNGTSAAAAMVSGVVALMLSANPMLGWREVRDILIRRARPIDEHHSGLKVDLSDRFFGQGGSGLFEAEPPWMTNAAGLRFHNGYGFGAIDAQAAVAEAQRRTSRLPPFKEGQWVESSYGLARQIPDFDPAGVSDTLTVDEAMTIEAVQVRVQISHDMPVDLAIELISPAGTRSVLIGPYTALTQANIDGQLASNAFYGEACAGTWTLKVTDLWQRNAGTLDRWSIRCLGH